MPCHRVLAAGGKPGGFSACGGVVTKLRLLTIEGAQPGGPTLFEGLPLAAARQRRRLNPLLLLVEFRRKHIDVLHQPWPLPRLGLAPCGNA